MCSIDSGSAVAPLARDCETASSVILAPAAPSLEKCAACGTTCRPNRSPQLLPCLHSVCKVCVPPAGAEEKKTECPSCKRSYNVLEVTDNPLLKDSTTGPGMPRINKCAGCEDTAISGWCVECGEALCSICVSAHQRVRVTREHTVLPQKLPPGFIPTLFCPVHREEPMKLFCASCNQLTCRDCQLTYHRNHSYQFLDEAVSAQREELKSLLVRVRQQRVMVKQTLLDLDGRLQDLEEIKSKMKTKLQKVIIYIRCALMKKTAELFKTVQDVCMCEARKIKERQNNLRTLEERQQYILSFTERALQMENHSALLTCKKQVQSQLRDLLAQSATPPAAMIDVRLHFEQESFSQIASFGNVVLNKVPFSHKKRNAVPKKSSLPPVPRQNIHPAPSSYQPYSSTVPTPSPSHSPLASPPITPTTLCSPSVSPALSSVTSMSAVTSHASLTPVSHQSTTTPPLPSGYSSSASAPPPPYRTRVQSSAQPSPAPLPHQHPRQRRNRQTWSFHPYQPKLYKSAHQQLSPCSTEPPHLSAGVPPPAPSSLPAFSESQSPPVSVCPVPSSPALIMALSPLGPNVPEASPEPWNTRTVETTETEPCAIQQESPSESPSLELAKLTGCVQPDKEEQQSRTQLCVLPIKAPADSPCERAPPFGCERLTDPSPPATENEPTSTVTETLPVSLPQAERAELPCATGSPDSCCDVNIEATLTSGSSAEISAGVDTAACGHADAVVADDTAGHAPALPARGHQSVGVPEEPQPATISSPAFSCSLQTQGQVRVQSYPQSSLSPALTVLKDVPSLPVSSQNNNKPLFQRIKMQHEEGKTSNSRNTDPNSAVCQQAPPSWAGPIQIPCVRDLDKCNTWLPSSLREILETPSANLAQTVPAIGDKNPLLRKLLMRVPSAETALTDWVECHGFSVETQMTDDGGNGEDGVGRDPKNENEESGGLVSRLWLPLVSVMRLPVSLPPSGEPLPQFRLLPGTTEDEILLQMIEEDQFSGSQSARAAKRGPTAHLSNQSKAKLIVLRVPTAKPTQPRLSPPCPAQQQPVSVALTSQPAGSSHHHSHKATQLRCAACQISGSLTVCAKCGRGFHRDCHIPPISSASSSADWKCMLCRDLSEVEDLYSDERPRRPSLSLPDQRKCEHLLLALMCKKHSYVLYRKVEMSSHYIDITLIRGRLLRKLSPAYRTPSEFVSDIWVLLESLLKNSEEAGLIFRMQKYFQKKLSKTFGDSLHPTLLKCPSREEDEEGELDPEEESGKVRETLKRMREFIAANRESLAKKACKDPGM